MRNWVKTLIGDTQSRLLGLLRRAPRTITSLAEVLGLTDNAVRTHIAALTRDGIVLDAGIERNTGGKPARLYGLTQEGEELFPKAYAAVLTGVIDELVRKDGRAHAIEVLRAVGKRVAASAGGPEVAEKSVEAAAAALRGLGGDVDIQRTPEGWRLQGYACPLSAVAAEREEVCALAQALVASITGRAVTECCERAGRPRCAFLVAGETDDGVQVAARRKRAS